MKGTLSCNATDCVNNISGICSAITIHVLGLTANSSESTRCKTFSHKGLKNALDNVLNNNVVGEFKQVFNNESIVMNPRVRCEAINCIHNVEEICKAKNVLIEEVRELDNVKTRCDTFKKLCK
ncbi:DUF1540 domain-containing protein [Clostridium sp.]|uniref:DUF1540 domain-containing protein n=1 Tax=Clostridium sp. TaxID=1506 RepID=UPI003D6D416C